MQYNLNFCFSPIFAALRRVFRDVAQPGSAHVWGAWGRKFKSCRPDKQSLAYIKRPDNSDVLRPFTCKIKYPALIQFQYRQECFLWYFHVTYLAHSFLAFFLFFQELGVFEVFRCEEKHGVWAQTKSVSEPRRFASGDAPAMRCSLGIVPFRSGGMTPPLL